MNPHAPCPTPAPLPQPPTLIKQVADFILSSIAGGTADANAKLRGCRDSCAPRTSLALALPLLTLGTMCAPRTASGAASSPFFTRDAFAALSAPKPLLEWDMFGSPLAYLASEGTAFLLATPLTQALSLTLTLTLSLTLSPDPNLPCAGPCRRGQTFRLAVVCRRYSTHPRQALACAAWPWPVWA